jgi:pimeloyl-ACP methyl ester carboxylesterase
VRFAAQHPEQVTGLVLIDGAYPIATFDDAGKQKVRTQFRRLRWIVRLVAAFGRSARMSPAEAAGVLHAAGAQAEASNKRVAVFATAPHNHLQILRKAPDTVVAAIEDVIHQPSTRSHGPAKA